MGAKIVTGMITLSLSVVEEMLSKVGTKNAESQGTEMNRKEKKDGG